MDNLMPQQANGSSDQTLQTLRQIDEQIQSMYNDLEVLSVQQTRV